MELELIDPYSFEAFWDEYDKKVERVKCERKWNKLPLCERKKAMEYIPLYKEAQPNKQYRKNPDTFINNKSWNDEIINYNNRQQISNAGILEQLQKSIVIPSINFGTGGQADGL